MFFLKVFNINVLYIRQKRNVLYIRKCCITQQTYHHIVKTKLCEMITFCFNFKRSIWDSRLELGYDSKIIPGNPTFRILVLNLDFLL